jgi:uncharacterized membrane protein
MTLPSTDPAPGPRSIAATIRNRLLTGLLLVIPAVVTLWIVAKVYGLTTSWAMDWVAIQPFAIRLKDLHGGGYPYWFEPGVRMVTLLFLLLFLFLVGELARHTFFRRALGATERFLLQLPLVKIIYMTCKQIVEAVSKPGGGMFRQVVLFQHPRPGIWALGFVTNEDTGAAGFSGLTGRDMYSIFLPTTPNPTSGFLLFIPKEECLLLEMTITDAMRLIISGGAIHPETLMPAPMGQAAPRKPLVGAAAIPDPDSGSRSGS